MYHNSQRYFIGQNEKDEDKKWRVTEKVTSVVPSQLWQDKNDKNSEWKRYNEESVKEKRRAKEVEN